MDYPINRRCDFRRDGGARFKITGFDSINYQSGRKTPQGSGDSHRPPNAIAVTGDRPDTGEAVQVLPINPDDTAGNPGAPDCVHNYHRLRALPGVDQAQTAIGAKLYSHVRQTQLHEPPRHHQAGRIVAPVLIAHADD